MARAIPVEPVYLPSNAPPPQWGLAALLPEPRLAGRGWGIRQRLPRGATLDDAAAAVSGGATSVEFTVTGGEVPRPLASCGSLEAEVSLQGITALETVERCLDARLRGGVSCGFEPLARGAGTQLLAAAARIARDSPSARLFRADTLVHAVRYLQILVEAGLSPSDATDRLELVLPLDTRFFDAIARLRAIRLVWARLLEVSGDAPDGAHLRIVALGSAAQAPDLWSGVLSNTAVAFAGAVGGADLIQLLPPDDSAQSARLARNTSLILREESSLALASDAALGSFFLETRTAQLAERLWAGLVEGDAELRA
jgi:methylmalonyl-CoA mutase